MKSFKEAILEAVQQKNLTISSDTIGGGLKAPKILFDTTRNDTKEGTVELEFFGKGPKKYIYKPSQEILDNLAKTDGPINYGTDETKQAEEIIKSKLADVQSELMTELTQLFDQLDDDIRLILRKHNIFPSEK